MENRRAFMFFFCFCICLQHLNKILNKHTNTHNTHNTHTHTYIYISHYIIIYIYICVCVCAYISSHKWWTTQYRVLKSQKKQKQNRYNIYVIVVTMCPTSYHRNGFVATHALGYMIYGLSCAQVHNIINIRTMAVGNIYLYSCWL